MPKKIETFGERLKRLIDGTGMTQTTFALETGIEKGTISRYITGKRQPEAGSLGQLATRLNVSMDYLWTGQEDPAHLTEAQTVYLDRIFTEKVGGPEDNQLIPRITGEIAAGSARILNDDILDYLTFKTSFLSKIPKNTDRPEDEWQRFVLADVDRVTGWSMWPIMMPGDTLLIDRHCTLPMPVKKSARSPTRRPIYAVKIDDGVTVKYVEFDEKNGFLILIPENTDYDTQVIRMDRGKAVHDYVVGRVAWIGRALG